MQFYHPEILFGLFALAIPIIVHLFQLRKFKIEPFTNVAFLQKLVISSRKSSKLKKWLSLIARLLTFTFLVIAFSQPFIPNPNLSGKAKEINIFLDNSLSMSLKGENTTLFNQAKEELLSSLPSDQNYNLVTHNEVYRNLNTEEFKSILFDIDYYPKAINLDKILQKTEAVFNSENKKEMVILSDFQYFNIDQDSLDLSSNINYNFINYKSQNPLNLSIDSVYLESSASGKLLKFQVSSSDPISQNVPISIYNGKQLLGRFSLKFSNQKNISYNFNIEQDELNNGKIEIEDIGLKYDNEIFFSVSKPETINVLVISENSSQYLDRVYKNERLQYKQVLVRNLEFEEITASDVVILNEVEEMSNPLKISITNFNNEGGVVAIIPSKKANINSYNSLFSELGLEPFSRLNNNEIKLTDINLDHPLFNGVFTRDIDNFDYPTFKSYFAHYSSEKALSFSNGLSFLESKSNIFRFNAPITDNSNFMQSPLFVLSFFNIALRSKNEELLYLMMGNDYTVKLKEKLQQDEVLKVSKNEFNFIPFQKAKGKTIKINFDDYPEKPGQYYLLNTAKDTLDILSFNIPRNESELQYLDTAALENINTYFSFENYVEAFQEKTEIKSLWQWFIALALMFMIIELLLLRFIK